MVDINNNLPLQKLRVILYPRVSSLTQLKQGDSIEAQEVRLKEYSNEKGYEIIDTYTDAGKSATIQDDSIDIKIINDNMIITFNLNKRPAFKRILLEAKQNKFDAIIFFRWDRFSRDRSFSKFFKIYLGRLGVRLIPTDDNDDPFITDVRQAMAEEETRVRNYRVRQTRLLRFNKGFMVARSPYGYVPIIKDKKVIGFKPSPKQAQIVQNAFKLTIEGKDYKDICKQLKIAPQSYYNIIRNKVYAGFITFEGKEKKGCHEALIDQDTYDKANFKLKK